MGVTFIAKEGTYTAPATLTTKSITENGTYSAVDDSANGYSSVTVNVEGGGGSSDFSTAEVTVVNNLGQVIRNVNCFAYYEAGSLGGGSPACVANFIQLAEGSNTINTVLYKGGAYWRAPFDEDVTIVTSGDVTNNDGMLFITGDCTITIS